MAASIRCYRRGTSIFATLTRVQHSFGAALKRADVGYVELAERLTKADIPETEGFIAVKINQGHFRHGLQARP